MTPEQAAVLGGIYVVLVALVIVLLMSRDRWRRRALRAQAHARGQQLLIDGLADHARLCDDRARVLAAPAAGLHAHDGVSP